MFRWALAIFVLVATVFGSVESTEAARHKHRKPATTTQNHSSGWDTVTIFDGALD